jgi:hypothetical protein
MVRKVVLDCEWAFGSLWPKPPIPWGQFFKTQGRRQLAPTQHVGLNWAKTQHCQGANFSIGAKIRLKQPFGLCKLTATPNTLFPWSLILLLCKLNQKKSISQSVHILEMVSIKVFSQSSKKGLKCKFPFVSTFKKFGRPSVAKAFQLEVGRART